MEFVSTRRSDEEHIKIKIRLVGDMTQEDPHYIQFFNIIMRKCLEHLQLQLVGRNYFDARETVSRSLHEHIYVLLDLKLIIYINGYVCTRPRVIGKHTRI